MEDGVRGAHGTRIGGKKPRMHVHVHGWGLRWEQNSAWVCGPGGGRLQRGANAWRPPFGSHRDGGWEGRGSMMPPSPPQTSRLRSLVSPFPAGTARGRGGGVCVRGEMVARPRPGTLAWFPPPAASVPGGQRRGRGGKGRAKRSAAAAAGRRQPRTPALPSGCSPHPPSPFSRDSVEGCARGAGGVREGDGGAAGSMGDGAGRGMGWDVPSPVIPRSPCPPPAAAPNSLKTQAAPPRPWAVPPPPPPPPPPRPSSCPSLRKFPRRTHAHIIQSVLLWLISYLTKADPDVKAAAPPTTRAAMAAVSFIWGWGAVLVRCDVCCCGSMEDRAWWGSGNGRGAETGRDGQRGRGAEQRLMRGGGGASGERGGGGKGGTGRGPFGLASLPR